MLRIIVRGMIVVANLIAGMLTRWIDSLATDCQIRNCGKADLVCLGQNPIGRRARLCTPAVALNRANVPCLRLKSIGGDCVCIPWHTVGFRRSAPRHGCIASRTKVHRARDVGATLPLLPPPPREEQGSGQVSSVEVSKEGYGKAWRPSFRGELFEICIFPYDETLVPCRIPFLQSKWPRFEDMLVLVLTEPFRQTSHEQNMDPTWTAYLLSSVRQKYQFPDTTYLIPGYSYCFGL